MTDPVYLQRPERSDIRALPPFEGLARSQVVLLKNAEQIREAEHELADAACVGLDTESKPVFVANQPKSGPHLIQIATARRAFLCQAHFTPGLDLFRKVLVSERVTKVGVGLKSDLGPLQALLGTRLQRTLELSALVKQLGYEHLVGLQMGVAIVLGRYFRKSKRITTSNWASAVLSDAQLLYAANDAYASLKIYEALEAKLER